MTRSTRMTQIRRMVKAMTPPSINKNGKKQTTLPRRKQQVVYSNNYIDLVTCGLCSKMCFTISKTFCHMRTHVIDLYFIDNTYSIDGQSPMLLLSAASAHMQKRIVMSRFGSKYMLQMRGLDYNGVNVLIETMAFQKHTCEAFSVKHVIMDLVNQFDAHPIKVVASLILTIIPPPVMNVLPLDKPTPISPPKTTCDQITITNIVVRLRLFNNFTNLDTIAKLVNGKAHRSKVSIFLNGARVIICSRTCQIFGLKCFQQLCKTVELLRGLLNTLSPTNDEPQILTISAHFKCPNVNLSKLQDRYGAVFRKCHGVTFSVNGYTLIAYKTGTVIAVGGKSLQMVHTDLSILRNNLIEFCS